METRTIFFMGKPGCGKGTQAKLLSDTTGWPIIASGRLFREIAAQDTPVGRKIKEENDAGILQPYWFASYLYERELFALPDGASAIFDGFNRKVQEAQLVIDSLQWLGRSLEVICLDISDDEVRARLAKRKVAEGRRDDEDIETRLVEYATYTKQAIELFRSAGVLREISGAPAPEKIAEEIRAVLQLA